MLLRRLAKLNLFKLPCRMLTTNQEQIIQQKGTGDEQHFMNRQDYKSLTALLKKMHGKILDTQPDQKQALNQLEEKQLREILQKHETRVSESMFNEILEWKRDHVL